MRGAETRVSIAAPIRSVVAATFALVFMALPPCKAAGESPVVLVLSAPPAQRAARAKIVVAITNNSNATMWVYPLEICLSTTLTITNARGETEQPDPNPYSGAYTCAAHVITVTYLHGIEPGSSYYGYGSDPDGNNITDWGYHLKPGTYVIQAVLEHFTTFKANRGARAWIVGTPTPSPQPAPDHYPSIKSNVVKVILE